MKDAEVFIIDGAVDVSKNPVTLDEFLDRFVEWLESNQWSFGGGTMEDDE